MPTIFELFGLRFFFYANEHSPVHVHVVRDDDEAKIALEPEIKLVYNHGLKERDVKRALELTRLYSDEIMEMWHKYHD